MPEMTRASALPGVTSRRCFDATRFDEGDEVDMKKGKKRGKKKEREREREKKKRSRSYESLVSQSLKDYPTSCWGRQGADARCWGGVRKRPEGEKEDKKEEGEEEEVSGAGRCMWSEGRGVPLVRCWWWLRDLGYFGPYEFPSFLEVIGRLQVAQDKPPRKKNTHIRKQITHSFLQSPSLEKPQSGGMYTMSHGSSMGAFFTSTSSFSSLLISSLLSWVWF